MSDTVQARAVPTMRSDLTAEQPQTSIPAQSKQATGSSLAGPRLVASKPAQVAIIGAGPYGLSIAAHLRGRGIRFRIFGRAMDSWACHMPKGMLLKSEGFASTLHDPQNRHTLKWFCEQTGLPYADMGLPIPLETMVAYGRSFQQELVPNLEERVVSAVDQAPNGFVLQLDNGEQVGVQQVIVATGFRYFQYVPPGLEKLPAECLSHSSQLHDLSHFQGRDVIVVGAGSSALDLAASLHEVGAEVRLLVRGSTVAFNLPPRPKTRWGRIRSPLSGLGWGWRHYVYSNAPNLFRRLPREMRQHIVKTSLGPAGGWHIRERVEGRVPMLLGCTLKDAKVRDGRVHLQVRDQSGATTELVTDHVIAATGYRVDVRRLDFLEEGIRSRVQVEEYAPVLSRNFESSVPGLYFVGLTSASCFGPVMRFVCGARYTATRLAKHLKSMAQ